MRAVTRAEARLAASRPLGVRGGHELGGVLERDAALVPGQHAGDLRAARVAVERDRGDGRLVAARALPQGDVSITVRRDLREVRHAHDLRVASQPCQACADG